MKLIFKKETLSEIINTVQKAVTSKSVMPILECIKIEAGMDGKVIFTANNLDICIEYNSECRVEEPGAVAISSKMFGEIIRRFPNGDVFIIVNESNNVMTLKCGKSEFNIQGLNAMEYPSVPEVEEVYRFKIGQQVLKRMIRKTIYAISQNEAKKPILTGSLFEINTGVLTVVSTDGYRIAKIDQTVDASLENKKFVVPGLSLREIFKVLEDGDNSVEIILAKRYVKFSFEGYSIVTRLLEGEYINYKPIFNTPNSIVVNVNTKMLCESIERAALIINDDITAKAEKLPIRLKIYDNTIDLRCATGRGNISDNIEIEKIGEDIEIGFNHKYLQEALRCCEDEVIKLEFSNPRSACFIRPTENNDYLYMVLPVRLYDDNN